MSDTPEDYRVGYGKPPLHTRFGKGRSGNPLGGRRRRPDDRLSALLQEALDASPTRRRRPRTRRQAIVAALVEKSAGGDLQAIKLLLDLMRQTDLAADPEPDFGGEDPRDVLIRELDRLAAEEEAKAVA